MMNLGYSHQVEMEEIPGITIDVPAAEPGRHQLARTNRRSAKFAAQVREKRPPEPYKGKGIKYADEAHQTQGR